MPPEETLGAPWVRPQIETTDMSSNFATLAWDSDIELALARLARSEVADPDYWSDTVDTVEQGFDPDTRERLTTTTLKAWVARCKVAPTADKEAAHASPTRIITPAH